MIVPSRSRSTKLVDLAEALARQHLPSGLSLELVVAIDGDGEPNALPAGLETTVLAEDFVGISDARNKAIAASGGDLLVVVNDDIVPSTGFIAAHARAHATQAGVRAVVGESPWRSWEQPTVFDMFVAHTPALFDRGSLRPRQMQGFRSAWGLNISYRRASIVEHDGPYAGPLRPIYFDDVEFAHRVFGEEACVYHEPDALAEHNHRVGVREYFWRETMLGVMAPELHAVNPRCYDAIFPLPPADLAARGADGLELDIRDHTRLFEWFTRYAAEPAETLGTSPAHGTKGLFAAHLPLKRRAFRLGLRAAMQQPDLPWQSRPELATRTVAEDEVFAALYAAAE